MSLGRRTFLKSLGVAAAAAPFARTAFAETVQFTPQPGNMRSFELTTHVEIAAARGATRVWVPVPAGSYDGWFEARDSSFSGNARTHILRRDPRSGAAFVEAIWDGDGPATLDVVSRFATRDRAIDPMQPARARVLTRAEQVAYLAPTALCPLDGIVRETALKITAGTNSDIGKLRAIYEWVVDNSRRDAATRGCGGGDTVAFLESGDNRGGKCADINPLMVGLARAAGIPARDLYGIRVAPSRFGYKALGASSEVVTKAQHCRAEAYIAGLGWLPLDPADVRKVALEEPGVGSDMTHPKVVAARKTLFGAWETNWVPFNNAQDVHLSAGKGRAIPFLMYPQAQVGGEMLDSLSPDAFAYKITVREVTA